MSSYNAGVIRMRLAKLVSDRRFVPDLTGLLTWAFDHAVIVDNEHPTFAR